MHGLERGGRDDERAPAGLARAIARLRCPVRACGLALEARAGACACARGHGFDRARSGYFNLLQAQDRRSPRSGDSAELVAARGRLLAAGTARPLFSTLRELIAGHTGGHPYRLLDMGCGEGSFVEALASEQAVEAHGVDLSVAALAAAARRMPWALWIAANADRRLPYAGASFDVLTSIQARLNPAEMRRVLATGGLCVVAVPSPLDLAELRAALLGEAHARDRRAGVRARMAGSFREVSALRVEHRVRLSAELSRDALLATYRAGRRSRAAALARLEELDVSFSWDVLGFVPG